MNTIETIRAEVERLKGYYRITNPYDKRAIRVCEKLPSFLSTLQEQPVCEGFSDEFDRYFLPKNREKKGRWGFADIYALARHFYELGQQSKPKMSEDVEEEAMNYIAPIENEDGLKVINFSGQDIKDAFIAGASWQKEQMMKEAVEGKIYGYDDGSFELIASWLDMPKESKFKFGDRVRIIIVKEEGK